MKHTKLTSLLLVLAMTITSVVLFVTPASAEDADIWGGTDATSFAGGTGTENDPYQISNGAELAYLASLVNKGDAEYNAAHYILTDDIVLNDPAAVKTQFDKSKTSGAVGTLNNWPCIGTSSTDGFMGTFDGNSKTIYGLWIVSGTEDNGLFGKTNGATIKNLTLDNAYEVISFHTKSRHSLLVGQALGSTIEKVTIRNSAFAAYKANVKTVGLLAGSISGTTVSDCVVENSTLNFGGTAQYWAFGIGATSKTNGASYIQDCNFVNCSLEYYNKKTVGFSEVGGILSFLENDSKVEITGCNVLGCTLRGSTRVGGIVGAGGSNPSLYVDNCVFVGTLIADGAENANVKLKDGAGKDVVNASGKATIYSETTHYTAVGGILGYYSTSSSGASLAITNCSVKANVELTDNQNGADVFQTYNRYLCVGGLIGRGNISNTTAHFMNNKADLCVAEPTFASDAANILARLNSYRTDEAAIATLVDTKTCIGMDGTTTVATTEYIREWVAANEASVNIALAIGGVGGELTLTKSGNRVANNAFLGSVPTSNTHLKIGSIAGRSNCEYTANLVKLSNNLYAPDLGITSACGGTDYTTGTSAITTMADAITALNDKTAISTQAVWTASGTAVPAYNDWTMTNDSVATAASVTLGDALAINVYANEAQTIAIHPMTLAIDGVAAKGTVEGNKVKYTISEIKASELDLRHTITVTRNGYRLQSFDYSVSKYIQRMTGKDAKLDAVLNALDTYGKAAAGQDVDVDEAYAAVTLTPVANVDNTYVTGIALVLAETVRPIVKVAEGVAQVNVEIYGQTYTYDVVDGEVIIDCVTATSLNNVMTLTFLDAAGNELGTTKYAVANYLLSVLGDLAKAEYHDLAKALAVYMEAARIYNNLPIE